MERKLFWKVSLGSSLVIVFAMAAMLVHFFQYSNPNKPVPATNLSQGVFYPSCLADQTKLANYLQSPYLSHIPQLIQFTVLKVNANDRCSDQFALINHEAANLPEPVLKVAMKAYLHARAMGLDKKQVLTVVDYQKPSDQRRLWVFDLKNGRMLFDTFVAHGANSGKLYAERFSNAVDSYESSLGVILTGESYDGVEGYSLRLHGLEAGFNDNIYKRTVVVHPAYYVNRSFVMRNHEAGKTYGCLGVSENIATDLINTIKDGTIIVNYFPNKQWLYHSQFLR